MDGIVATVDQVRVREPVDRWPTAGAGISLLCWTLGLVGPAALITGAAIIVVGNALAARVDGYDIPSPLSGPHLGPMTGGSAVATLLSLAGLMGCLASVVVKFRRAEAIARRQIGWYAYGYAVTLVVLVTAVTTDLPSEVLALGPVTVAAGAGIAILRYRLYDIDRIVN